MTIDDFKAAYLSRSDIPLPTGILSKHQIHAADDVEFYTVWAPGLLSDQRRLAYLDSVQKLTDQTQEQLAAENELYSVYAQRIKDRLMDSGARIKKWVGSRQPNKQDAARWWASGEVKKIAAKNAVLLRARKVKTLAKLYDIAADAHAKRAQIFYALYLEDISLL